MKTIRSIKELKLERSKLELQQQELEHAIRNNVRGIRKDLTVASLFGRLGKFFRKTKKNNEQKVR